MRYQQLGDSDLWVSELCIGTMTFAGQQNTIETSQKQIDYAISHGINFIDTAELYPLPGNADTQGDTEIAIGQWLAKQQRGTTPCAFHC